MRGRCAEIINFRPANDDDYAFLTIYAVRIEPERKEDNPTFIYRCPLCCKVHVRTQGSFNPEQNGWEQKIRCFCHSCHIRTCSRLQKLPQELRNLVMSPFFSGNFILRETSDESRAGHIPVHIKREFKR